MKGLQRQKSFLGKRAARAALSMVVATMAAGAAGCLDRPIEPVEPRITATIVERLTQSSVDKIDILLAIDNSRSMADKQQILALAVPDLVAGLVNPRCVDDNGVPVSAMQQPSYPTQDCPAGTKREFQPILDIHIGVISSSIGGHGADSCPNSIASSKECSPQPNTTNNDKGHLLSRLNQCGGASVDTYPYGTGSTDKGFLAWDPEQKLSPLGEADIPSLQQDLRDMVIGTGQIGCGYESQLESIYRFLADPEPYETISIVNNRATPDGTDTILLQQRAEFMRPDSLLAIVMLTDENDCSIKEYGQFYYVGQLQIGNTNVRMPRARQECAADPNDPCCKSCGMDKGSCPDDPTCVNPQGGNAVLSLEEDDINLRCWDQKRRFGIDFLYPTSRYVQAFSAADIPNRAGDLVPNPIFSDLNPQDDITNIRDAGLVFFAGIVGVPWQDIARDKTDLSKGFKNANELNAPIGASGESTWDVILGSEKTGNKPLDPLMIESVTKRTGTNPITGDPLADASTPNANPLNGHEWTIANDDLQYACIFPLPAASQLDCTNTNLTACDCFEANNDNPLCQQDPNNGNAPTLQVRAKAYPGIRPLEVMRDLGDQGIVASVCPAKIEDVDLDKPDFGYRPAIGSIIDRLKSALKGQCLPRTLTPDGSGNVPCLILEARNTQGAGCVCDPALARTDIPSEGPKAKAVELAKADPAAAKAGWDCFCEITQLGVEEGTQDARAACQDDASEEPQLNGQPVNGWCYVDGTTTPPTGNVEIVQDCPANEKRIIRFVGKGEAQPGSTLFITCSGDTGGG
ncbi:hypothetical protein [Polyangium sp. 6x1]|uniref:hypothetical protein n=1 Tax=Polyangium sp. 6x1 TaxID=3042689 RepID=UPI00248310AF|nr:hypothetical protein [Polyangium sp. 6x1]MDI1443279.1 hypothetical protein [Polyangium sp. 6x1]